MKIWQFVVISLFVICFQEKCLSAKQAYFWSWSAQCFLNKNVAAFCNFYSLSRLGKKGIYVRAKHELVTRYLVCMLAQDKLSSNFRWLCAYL